MGKLLFGCSDADFTCNLCVKLHLSFRLKTYPGSYFELAMYVQKWCKACVLLDGLNRGLPRLGITRTRGKGSGNGVKNISLGVEKLAVSGGDRRPSVSAIDF